MPLSDEVAKIYRIEMIPKFLATADAQGRPNVALITSLDAVDAGTVIFGDFMMWKTKANLQIEPRVASVAATRSLAVAGFTGMFREFSVSGEYPDRIKSSATFRYNPYNAIRGAGSIDVVESSGVRRISKGTVLADLLAVKLLGRRRSGGVSMGRVVGEKFGRVNAFKVLAWVGDDGHPRIAPALSLMPAGTGHLAFRASSYNPEVGELRPGQPVAANVTTMEPISYQVKGAFRGFSRGVGLVEIEEVYSSSPPLAGERIA